MNKSMVNKEELQLAVQHLDQIIIARYFEDKNIDALCELEQVAYVLHLIFKHKIDLAELFYQKFQLNDPKLLAMLYQYSGNFEGALSCLNQQENPYLKLEVYFDQGNSEAAFEVLQQQKPDANWYCYMGRYYGSKYEYKQAIVCLEQAIEHSRKEKDIVLETKALSLCANYIFILGGVHKAHKYYKLMRKKLREVDFRSLPEFTVECFVNYGSFELNQGRYFSALRLLFKAYKLVQYAESSKNYNRSRLKLAAALFQLGYYKKSEQILKNTNPKRQFAQMDKERSLAKVNIERKNYLQAKVHIENAKQLLEDNDRFGEIYLLIDEMFIEYQLENTEVSEKLFHKIVELSNEREDWEAKNYCYSLYAECTMDIELAKLAHEYHIEHNFESEVMRNRNCIALCEIKAENYDAALKVLLQKSLSSNPKQELLRNNLISYCYLKLEKEILAKDYLEKATALINKKDLPFYKVLLLNIRMGLCSKMEDKARIQKEINIYLNSMDEICRRAWQYFFLIFDFSIQERIQIRFAGKQKQIAKNESFKFIKQQNKVVVDRNDNKFYYNGESWDNLDKYPSLQNLFFHLLQNHQCNKESIAQMVFERNEYNPINDDNLIYVSISRLKKLLPVKDLIRSKKGKYELDWEQLILIEPISQSA